MPQESLRVKRPAILTNSEPDTAEQFPRAEGLGVYLG